MSKFHFVRLCAVALLIFILAECTVEIVNLPNTISAVTSFDLQRMSYSFLGINPDTISLEGISPDNVLASSETVETVSQANFLQKTASTLLGLFLLSCQLLGALGILIVNRDSLGRFGRFSVRVWIVFVAIGLLSMIVPVVSSAMSFVDQSVEQKLVDGVEIANDSLTTEFPVLVEALEILQTAEIPNSYFVRVYALLIITTILVYAFLAFMAIKMWRDSKKFRYL